MKKRILFICLGNSCRSQMAEGWMKHMVGLKAEVFSAGISADGLNPMAVQVMREWGVDITFQQSVQLAEYAGEKFDITVILCDKAKNMLPFIPVSGKVFHRHFSDPADAMGADWQKLEVYRQVCGELKSYVEELLISCF